MAVDLRVHSRLPKSSHVNHVILRLTRFHFRLRVERQKCHSEAAPHQGISTISIYKYSGNISALLGSPPQACGACPVGPGVEVGGTAGPPALLGLWGEGPWDVS
jgi:hypothetical protein